MQTPPPFPTISLDDAPFAASLDALVASARVRDQVFELYPATRIDPGMHRFTDLWHVPDTSAATGRFNPDPLETAPVRVRAMRSALVHPASGLVFDAEGRALSETVNAQQFRDPDFRQIAPVVDTAQRLVRDLQSRAQTKPGGATTLYANHGGYTVFGHLMFETIPLALIFSPWLRSKQMTLLMPPTRSTAMPDGLLKLAGLNPSVQKRVDQPFIWCNGLVVSSTCSARPTFQPGPMMRDFARTIKATTPLPSGPRRRLFLTRAGERTTQRRDLTNEAELIAALTPLGFESVNPGLLPPRDQVALFARAECLVAMMGSVWANLIYAAPDTLIVDLLPEHKAAIGDRFGINAAKGMALPYILIVTPSEGLSAGQIDVTVDVPLVADRVRRGLDRMKTLSPR